MAKKHESMMFDKTQNRYRYFDKNGAEIHAGDKIRRASGQVEKVYEWENEFGERGLGTDATNPAWVESGRAVPCEFGIYGFDSVDCATCEVVRE